MYSLFSFNTRSLTKKLLELKHFLFISTLCKAMWSINHCPLLCQVSQIQTCLLLRSVLHHSLNTWLTRLVFLGSACFSGRLSVLKTGIFFFLLLLLFQWLRPVPHCKRITLFSSMYLCKSWTLHIFDGLEVTGQFLPALTGQGSLFVLGQFLQSVAVVSQIHLSPDQ